MSQATVLFAGRYRLEELIAAGGVGEVWRATDLVLDRPVAVKLLRPEYAAHPEALARFRAEARHAGSVSHPAIAQVYDYGEGAGPGSPYLVMELVDGPSLAAVLAAGPLDPARTMDVVSQAAAGLAAAHASGLVHRDIKPANLLLGPGGQVKITDFGIAHAAGSAPLTRTGMLVGTPAYLAPERAGGASATPASDLYSLGVVAYECLAGAPPFTGTALQVTAALRHRPLPPLPAAVPDGVAALVSELTAKDPAARPPDASDVAIRAGRLRDALAGGQARHPGPAVLLPPQAPTAAEPITLADIPVAGPPSAAQPEWRSRTWPRRGVLLALVATAVMAGLIGGILASAAGPASPQRQAGSPAPAGSSPAARTVDVNGTALVGLPADVVRGRLLTLGLAPRVVWIPASEHQRPGMVVSVQPTGQLTPGSTVTVTAAFRGHGHGHDHGNGQGNNGGD